MLKHPYLINNNWSMILILPIRKKARSVKPPPSTHNAIRGIKRCIVYKYSQKIWINTIVSINKAHPIKPSFLFNRP